MGALLAWHSHHASLTELRETLWWSGVPALLLGGVGYSAASAARRQRLLRAGIAATAIVYRVQSTSEGRARVALEVTLDGESPYRTVLLTKLSSTKGHNVKRGAVLPVRIDPDDRNRLAIDWVRLP